MRAAAKTVLGVTIKENGYKEGMEVLHMLATSPATAHFICDKIAVRFVSDNPPPALVNRMADAFLRTDGDIKAVLSTLFHSPEFWGAGCVPRQDQDAHRVCCVRTTGFERHHQHPLPLVQAMDKLGMPIYGMQTPNGYSWAHDSWVSSNALISRMNFALVLSGDLLPGTRTDWPQLLGESSDQAPPMAPSPDDERKLEALLLGQPAAERTRADGAPGGEQPDRAARRPAELCGRQGAG